MAASASPDLAVTSEPAGPAPLTPVRAVGLLVATAALLGLLGWKNPVTLLAALGTRDTFTEAQPSRRDPAHHDVGFTARLPPVPAGQKLVLFVGSSQQYTCGLPYGVHPTPDHECEVTSDLFARKLDERAPGVFYVFNAGAPNQSAVEMLWRSLRWYGTEHPPDVLVLQLAFDSLRTVGIRPQFQDMLSDERFAARVSELERSASGSYVGELTTARSEYEQRKAELSSKDGVESRLRGWLDHVPLYHQREDLRTSFLVALYNARVRFLGITPTTRRHITGSPRLANLEALRALISRARAAGSRVLYYNAPVNPSIDMFYEDEYRATLDEVRALVTELGGSYIDLARAVPASQWAYWINAPDPTHVTEEGHVTIAGKLDEAWGALLSGR